MGIDEGAPERARVYLEANRIPDDVSVRLDSSEAAGRSLASARRDAGMPLVDNAWLLPAEFIVAADGTVVYVYRYQFCENWIDPRVHVGAIRIARGELPRW